MADAKNPQIDALLQENRQFDPPPAFVASAHVRDPKVYDEAADDPEAFWARFAAELEWITPWTQVLDWQPPHAKWFVGGTLNASVELRRSARPRLRAATRPRSSGKASPAIGAR